MASTWKEYLENALGEQCTGSGKQDGMGKKKRKRKGKEKIAEDIINESKVKLEFRISPAKSKMRVVKTLDQIFKDYTREEVRDSNIDIVVNGEVVGTISGAKLSYRVM